MAGHGISRQIRYNLREVAEARFQFHRQREVIQRMHANAVRVGLLPKPKCACASDIGQRQGHG